METSRYVMVKRVPESLSQKQVPAFLKEIRPLLAQDRPQLVFDLSLVHRIDSDGVNMLLDCMEEAARRDGDLKLASVSPQAQVMLDLTRTGRLFQIFANTADAARSFSGYLPDMARQSQPAIERKSNGQAA